MQEIQKIQKERDSSKWKAHNEVLSYNQKLANKKKRKELKKLQKKLINSLSGLRVRRVSSQKQ